MNSKYGITIQGSFPCGKPNSSVLLLKQNLQLQGVQRNRKVFKVDDARLNLNDKGQILPKDILQKMESVFKADFSGVKIHTHGSQAKSIGALAFATGNDIYFAQGQYNPNTAYGQRLLGHELTHIIQQKNGRVKNPFGNGITVVQDPGMEAEAERMSRLVSIQPKVNNNYKIKSSMHRNGTAFKVIQNKKVIQPVIIPVFWQGLRGQEQIDDQNEINRGTTALRLRPDSGGSTIALRGDLRNLPNAEAIYIHGHGSPGLVGGYNAQELKLMLETLHLSRDYTGTIWIAACMSADSTYYGLGKSVAGKLAELLRTDNYRCNVKGMNGSIVIRETGDIRITDSAYAANVTEIGGRMQRWRTEAANLRGGRGSLWTEGELIGHLTATNQEMENNFAHHSTSVNGLNTTTYSGAEMTSLKRNLIGATIVTAAAVSIYLERNQRYIRNMIGL